MAHLIDSHTHLTDQQFDSDRAEVVRTATDAGVSTLVTVANDLEDSLRCRNLARTHPSIFATAGVHPHHADGWSEEESPGILSDLAPDALAIGEIGLDYFYNFSDRYTQRKVFSEQIEFAKYCNK
ncbi:MAG TPA: TatD family hydrolase, partial [bacterium]|nr:TatD family hydrolase [bacterium]